MNFVPLMKKSGRISNIYTADKVRMSFPLMQGQRSVLIFIGKDVARKFGFQKGDIILALRDEYDKYLWRLIKDPRGRKLQEMGKCLRLTFAWGFDLYPGWENTMKFVTVEQEEGQLQLRLPKSKDND